MPRVNPEPIYPAPPHPIVSLEQSSTLVIGTYKAKTQLAYFRPELFERSLQFLPHLAKQFKQRVGDHPPYGLDQDFTMWSVPGLDPAQPPSRASWKGIEEAFTAAMRSTVVDFESVIGSNSLPTSVSSAYRRAKLILANIAQLDNFGTFQSEILGDQLIMDMKVTRRVLAPILRSIEDQTSPWELQKRAHLAAAAMRLLYGEACLGLTEFSAVITGSVLDDMAKVPELTAAVKEAALRGSLWSRGSATSRDALNTAGLAAFAAAGDIDPSLEVHESFAAEACPGAKRSRELGGASPLGFTADWLIQVALHKRWYPQAGIDPPALELGEPNTSRYTSVLV